MYEDEYLPSSTWNCFLTRHTPRPSLGILNARQEVFDTGISRAVTVAMYCRDEGLIDCWFKISDRLKCNQVGKEEEQLITDTDRTWIVDSTDLSFIDFGTTFTAQAYCSQPLSSWVWGPIVPAEPSIH